MFEKRSDLLKFLAVAEMGKIQIAAEKLHTTQPALSRTIAKMEEQCGGQLFERIPSGVRLTALGSAIAEQVRHLLREMELAEGEVAALVSGQKGELRITAGPMWMRAYLPNVIRKFHDIYPGIQLQLRTKNYREAVRELADGSVDLHCGGFDNNLALPQFLHRESMMAMEVGVMANAAHPIFEKKTLTHNDLVAYPWLAYMGEHALFTVSDKPILTRMLDEIYQKCGKRVNSIVQCDASGLFLMGTAPYLALLAVNYKSKFSGHELRQVPLDFEPQQFQAGIIARRSIESTSAFRDFKELLEAEIKSGA